MEIIRTIAIFDKETENLLGEQSIAVPDFAELYRRYGAPADDPLLLNCYPIYDSDRTIFAPLVPSSFIFDFSKLDYFLEATSE